MIRYAFYNFKLGILKIGYTDTVVVSLDRVEQVDTDNEPSTLTNLVFKQISEYLHGQRQKFDFPYELYGTEFQKKVWEALRQIPYGETRTYKDIATVVGNPKASRAVGMANHKNPLMIVVPCHRVIGTGGKLVGYAGGLDMKKALLELEHKKYKHTILKGEIKAEISSFVKNYEAKAEISTKWGMPLVGFADAKHPFILNLKNIIGPNHELPTDVLKDASIVIAYYIPFTKELAKTNSSKHRLASSQWALAYEETNAMFKYLNQHIIEYLNSKGYNAAVSKESATFSTEKLISNWSHRHFAYIAGLGTFGINNMLITKCGCCGRFFTIVTNLDIVPDSPLVNELCLYKKNGSCKICLKNCPAGALTELRYNRAKCYSLLKENAAVYTEFGDSYFDETLTKTNSKGSEVCGKCITSSPCAF